jgi:hypothetical protein
MSEPDLHTPEGRAAAFAAFRARSYNRFMTRLRYRRADQIREIVAEAEKMTLDRFNHEIWQIGHRVLLKGVPITDRIFDGNLNEARVLELEAALEAGELQVEGNTIWRPGSGVYGPGLKEDTSAKEEHIRRALAILIDVKFTPSEKVERIVRLPGFGPGAANLLVMIAAPTAWALDNGESRGALNKLGSPAGDPIEVQVSASQLKDELGADDFIELDLFLYQLNQIPSVTAQTPQIWWIYQGKSYDYAKTNGFVQAGLKGADGREVSSWRSIEQVRSGDIILHHFQKYIRAVSRVQGDPHLVVESDGEQRRRVDTAYQEFDTPISFEEIAEPIHELHIPSGPIAKNLRPNQGYLYALNRDALHIIYDASPTNNWPTYVTDLLGVSNGGGTSTNGTGPRIVSGQIDLPSYEALLDALRNEGLFFPPEVISNYLLALQAKGFVILTGISGTGKTQLALEVAKYFQPTLQQTITAKPPDGARSLTTQRYNLQYNRMVLPVDIVDELGLSSDDGSGSAIVYYPGGTATLRLYKYPRRDTFVLLFSGPFRAWFHANLRQGDTFFLEVVAGDNEGVNALRFSVPLAITRAQRLKNYKVIAVRPDWTDNRGLLGYYNPLTGRYESTPFLRFLLEAQAEAERAARESRPPHLYFLILDEMNLARVEYYFADFLSCLESGETLELHDDPEIEVGAGAETEQLPIPRRLCVPRNLLFTGTVNIDETTSMFSPKVLDRAFTIEFNQVDLAGFGALLSTNSAVDPFALVALPSHLVLPKKVSSDAWIAFGSLEGGELRQMMVALNDLLASEQRHFGYRVANEIARFVNLAAAQVGSASDALWAALDLAILAKALPKIYGTQQELETILIQLFAFAVSGASTTPPAFDAVLSQWREQQGRIVPVVSDGSNPPARLPRTAAKLWRMLRRLRQQGFTAFVC